MVIPAKVTVLMGVFNSELFLKEAIDSILNQTFKDFKFLIINDGSTDGSEQIILSYEDDRIIYDKNPENIGIGRTVRKGMEMIHSKYVIRVDSDDISFPDRFQVQVDFMDSHPEIAIAGTLFDVIGDPIKGSDLYESSLKIRTRALFECPIIQPSVIINNEFIKRHQLNYDKRFEVAGDFALFLDTLKHGELAIIPKKLMSYRRHKGQVTSKKYNLQDEFSTTKKLELLEELSGVTLTKKERELYMAFSFHRKLENADNILLLKKTLEKIRKGYFGQKSYDLDKSYFYKIEYEKLKILLIENKTLGFPILVSYLKSYGWDFRIFMGLGLFLRIVKHKMLSKPTS